ncbi:MAG: hypothetical protein E7220_07880 [Clostridiales bacterium]|nr:hypothetical protein [Clostridiales bacterium]
MEYLLMRKDEVITLCDFAPDGTMISFSPRFRNPELAPLEFARYSDHLKRWWKNRQIPVGQGKVEQMLKERGLIAAGEYLLSNLGLSLTDYYWIKPIDASLKWKDVNLFDNDFRENLLTVGGMKISGTASSGFTPNSSLKGELEKSWVIRRGKRVLIKGNHGKESAESINEVIATKLHWYQKYDNYTKYRLIRIKDKPYDYGCCSEAFTDTSRELVSAYALLTSCDKPKGMSDYEFLIAIAGEYGIDTVQLRHDLEYQILTDYLLTNIDRHMENIGFIRDADTLKLMRMAPIFDTGRSFGGRGVVPATVDEIDNIEVNSFAQTESELLDMVEDIDVINMNKLVPGEYIEEMYLKDSKARPARIRSIVNLYKEKVNRLAAR